MSRRDCSATTPRRIPRKPRWPRSAPASRSASTPTRSRSGITVYQARDRARGRSQHHRGLGHRRSVGEAGRLHRRARQGDIRGRPSARGARRAGRARAAMVAGRQHILPAGQSRGRAGLSRKGRFCARTARQQRTSDDAGPKSHADTAQRRKPAATPAADVVDAVRALPRHASSLRWSRRSTRRVLSRSVMREFGRLGAFAHHLPGPRRRHRSRRRRSRRWRRRANIVCRRRSACGARTRSPGTSSRPHNHDLKDTTSAAAPRAARSLGGTALSNPMKTLLRHRTDAAQGQASRRRLCRPWALALRLQSRQRPLFRRDIRGRGRRRQAPRHGDLAVRRRGREPCRQYEICRARRHAHFLRADARRHRSRMPGSSPIRPRLRQAHPRRLRAAAGRHGLRPDPRLHQADRANRGPLGHVNKYLDVQPEQLAERLVAMESEVARLARRRSKPIRTIGAL